MLTLNRLSKFLYIARQNGWKRAVSFSWDYLKRRLSNLGNRQQASNNLYLYQAAYQSQGKIALSVVTPVYNTDPDVLEECFQSVLGQTYKNWEFCLCDDGSTREETIRVLKK
ncbi:glycosyltransferase [candidate division KSB1 bacterium]|nr:glycosyltransferase [candidate division KSB1 bacterium]NIS22863.1 glycosyltransferase [candidate division KSB1 bacterium]NIT69701.1 glycosyltransferase [candidate division KSB1 bacterium]NIU23369.1 glycosyltransferase [candidate division KSB1 bacterium]NIU92287.1 glycosyltransferase [candidate division KSB1 bacterium]